MSSILEFRPLRLIQITDLHLHEHAGAGLGWCPECERYDTEESLQSVLDHIQLNEACFDAIVVTGDIAQAATDKTYQRFNLMLANEGVPVFCLPGNHDDTELFYKTVKGDNIFTCGHRLMGNWLCIFMQSLVDGQDYGNITQSEFERVKNLLGSHPNHQVIIFTHHHPVPTGSAWLDEICLLNREFLLRELARYDQIRALVYGHVHQEADALFQHIRLLGTPSTCIQFLPQSASQTFDMTAPAYRGLTLHEDGSLETDIQYTYHQKMQKMA